MEAFGLFTEPWLSDIPGEEKMKKTTFALGACTILFALCLSGCDGILSSSDEGDGFFSKFEEFPQKGRNGVLTINNIPSDMMDQSALSNYRVYICSSGNEANPWYNCEAESGDFSVSGTTITVSLYPSYGYDTSSRWTGSGPYYIYLVENSYNSYGYSSNQIAAKSSSSILFSNGSATVDASAFTFTFPPASFTDLHHNTWQDGWIYNSGEENWYRFYANSGITIVQWKDSYEKDTYDSYDCDIQVSAYRSDGSVIFTAVDGGYTFPQSFSSYGGETIYLKVEGYNNSTGAYAIQYY
jgi:hypothetical protein